MTIHQKDILQKTRALLKKRYAGEPSGHDWFHIERVWNMAKHLARGERVDHFVLEMAALLHDVDDYKFIKEGQEELSHAKAMLRNIGVTGEEREHILKIVGNVSFQGARVPTVQKTLEGKIVQDADRLEAMGAIGIARTFIYNGHIGNLLYDPNKKPTVHKTFLSYKDTKGTAINHFYEKLLLLKDRMNTPQAKKIATRRHKFLEAFLAKFFAEVRESA